MRGDGRAPVLLVETGTGRGGSARSLSRLLSGLDRRRFAPVVAFHSDGHGLPWVEAQGIEVVPIARRRVLHPGENGAGLAGGSRAVQIGRFLAIEVLPGARALVRLIRRRGIRLVHVNNQLLSGLPAILAARLCGVPVLCHLRITRPLTRVERWVAPLVDRFVATSRMGIECFRASGIPAARLQLIYNGIERDAYDPATVDGEGVRRQLGVPDVPLVGVVARIARVKGQRQFLEAAARVLAYRSPVQFLVVGGTSPPEAEYAAGLRAYVETARIAPHVTFTGWREDVPEVTAALDLAVQPTAYWEGFCNAAVEAMMLEKPVIGTSAGALGEILDQGRAGIVLPNNEPDVLAGAIFDLLASPRKARDLARRGRERAERLFTLEKTVADLECVYDLLLARDGDPVGRGTRPGAMGAPAAGGDGRRAA